MKVQKNPKPDLIHSVQSYQYPTNSICTHGQLTGIHFHWNHYYSRHSYDSQRPASI